MASATLSIVPAHSLGPIHLGASLHEVLTLVKQDRAQYPKIDLHFLRTDPTAASVNVVLPQNGLRLRFDGADQRLRLIEVMDFKKIRLAYKGSELMKSHESSAGPAFKRIYQLFGASYPGEYYPPRNGAATGRYVLSWTGIAFTFPLQHSAYAAEKDHVSMLGSTTAASPATQMALFEGSSWPEIRNDLFKRVPTGPRSSALGTKPKHNLPSEIELAQIEGNGRIRFLRRGPAPACSIVLNETTPQDLITELGPPDATHKRDVGAAVKEQPGHQRTSSMSRPLSNGRHAVGSQPSSYSSTGTDTFDADFDSGDADEDASERASRETFWSYFSHGMDILVGPASDQSPITQSPNRRTPLGASPHIVVTKVVLHGNIPGSYAFNRHRRLRWKITLPDTEYAGDLTSENKFDDLKLVLLHIFQDIWPTAEMGKGKVVNRTWGASPSDSSFFLPDAGEDLVEGGSSEQWLGNTRLYTFPGMMFEVLENGSVSALTIY